MDSHSTGDLKMVKVKRGRKGHRQSRSLVFRISRTFSKSISDDSGIKCSSTEEKTSSDEDLLDPPPSSLKIRIPKDVINEESEKNDTTAIESFSPESLMLQNEGQRTNILDSNTDLGNGDNDDLNLNMENLNANSDILMNAASKQSLFETGETKSTDLRRSSRRILLRLQKDCQSDSLMNQPFNNDHKLPVASSHINEQPVTTVEKKKRGRKPGTRVADCKKRKFTRRGRPPKSSFPKQLNIVQPIISGGVQNEKLLLVPPKNSVWTLVPKKLFESDFFKSQVLKVRLSNPVEKVIQNNIGLPAAATFQPPVITQPVPSTSGKIQFKLPKMMVPNVPTIRLKNPDERDPKRPTVIYFKTEKKNFDYSEDLRERRNSQLPVNNENSKTQNDLLYLFNKYRMLEDIILKNYYELASGNLTETESMLSNLLSNNPAISVDEKFRRVCVPQTNLTTCSVLDQNSTDQALHHVETNDASGCFSSLDDVDTLHRKVLVESLLVLFSEEAVLA